MMQFLIAAPSSGSGKTTVACAVLAALKKRGADPCAFKSGPDYIDPMFHRSALQVDSHNLDLFLSNRDMVRAIFARYAAGHGAAVCEGAMGFYDGQGLTTRASAWELAETLGLPVLLVVQPKGASVTLAAQIQGLVNFRKNSHVSGILLNDCSEKLYKMLKALLERETGLPVLGYLPHLPQAAVESRHLGLKTADEIADLQEKIALLADALVLDWQRLAVLTEKPAPEALPGAAAPTSVRIAVAKDEAFCFTYAETLDALRDAGAELVLFSPVQDAVLPENIGGLYLPGGYPELYAKTLSENKTMLASIRQAVQAGLPTAAECGGFLYLGRSLEDADGKAWPMADVLPGDGIRVGRLVRFGYAEMTAKADSMLFCAGETLPIHEFHHWDSTANGTAFTACKSEKMQWECGFANENFYAGFPHLYWAGTPLPGRFVRATMLEDAAALTGSAELDLSRRVVVVLCADNGVVAQGVSQTGQEVTRAVAENLAMRRTSVCQMARTAHCDVLPVDMGMAGEPVPGVRSCRIAAGTADFTKGPAMSRAEAVQAVGEGIALARELAEDGYRLIATGEMGIGNTTTSSAVAAVLLGQPVELMTGRGAGLSDEGLARKVDAICRGILCNEPDPEDTLDVLAKLGGFDIAGLCGVFLGGALAGVPVLADGFISGVAALCAVRLCPAAAKAVFASHCSAEPAARIVLEALGKAPIITAGLHLGEGTGAVASIPLWDMALAVYGGCYSFAEGGIAPYTPQC